MTTPATPIPAPIGAVHFNQARAVFVRDDEATGGSHSAVQSQFIVYTDTQLQANALISHWEEIMQAAADKAQEIMDNATTSV